MNISNNNLTFNGRKEVLYGLKKAASEAVNAESYNIVAHIPKPIDKSLEAKLSERAMNVYMEMAVFDDSFESVISNFPKNNELKEILKPEDWYWSVTNPVGLFRKCMMANITKLSKPIDLGILKGFFEKISTKEIAK